MQRPDQDAQQGLEMSLREHLLAAQAPITSHALPQASSAQVAPVASMHASSSASPHDHQVDPSAFAAQVYSMSAGESGGDDVIGPDGKRTKRELSTSKRAAQNRAAQRAFRQRKEGYIKKLEDENKSLLALQQNYKTIQEENYQLRDYILNLQSRLLESQSDFPQPPPNIQLPHPQDAMQQVQNPNQAQYSIPSQGQTPQTTAGSRQQSPPITSAAVSQLQAAAAQAGELGNASVKHQHEEAQYLPHQYSNKRAKHGVTGGTSSYVATLTTS
ncbi:hypothetical protein LTR16_002634 [Cryomyces antarcticus]|uniref:Putative transcription factor kapC n=1 Tax=Cryomyces antarcticus TaxID=329879 RepID=A0ABR0KUI8_9PEZI|nr:hypothetical protein LTR16_002634 [Cryomyces antarcticus]